MFCGAGGFSSGFAAAGFDVVLGVDNWPAVEETYRANHAGDFLLADVGDLGTSDFPRADVVIGSPPCPEFSVANKRRDPEKGMVLVREYERVVDALRPRWFVMENVPPVQPFLSPLTYPSIRVLNAADYGVPQVRRRCLAGRFPLPRPTHGRVPSTTLDGREVLPWVTVRDAIGTPVVDNPLGFGYGTVTEDEPSPTMTTRGDLRSAADDGGEFLTAKQVERMKYLRSAKPHLKTKGAPDGTMVFPDRADRPARTLTSFAGGISREGFVFDEEELGRRALDRPAFTIAEPYLVDPRRVRNALGLTRPTGQNEKRLRRLTLRECARLQSFPDDFEFLGTKTAKYRMVGNAVPPLLARRVAEAILREEGGQTRLGKWGS